ncbi:Ff.00g050070.m01.CDS01 [Fusarium sp. VM40]|nr:Ff.00g050070.m01.CDS01 [Fusarium sp. VM40]
MKRLHLTRGFCIEGDDEDIWAQGHESMLYRMKFEQCVLDGPFLKHALRCCKNLGELFLSLLDRFPSQGRYRVSIDLDMYGDALRDFGHNLVKLALSGFNSSAYAIVGKIGSLRQLERLTYLEIERQVLGGHEENKMPIAEVLPLSLECFRCCIQRHDVGLVWQEKVSELEDEMMHLIDSGRFPKL